MKKLKNLKGLIALSKSEKKRINGGSTMLCLRTADCPGVSVCCDFPPFSGGGICILGMYCPGGSIILE